MMAKRRARGWWYPWIFVGGMALVIVVNGAMAWFAIGTFPGLETADHYRKGLNYNANLAADRRQQELGWRMDIEVSVKTPTDGPRVGLVSARFTDSEGRPLDSLAVDATLFRPTHEGYDQSLDLTAVGGGRYRGETTIPLPGLWAARIHARRGGDMFQTVERIEIR